MCGDLYSGLIHPGGAFQLNVALTWGMRTNGRTAQSIELAAQTAREQGAITSLVYSTDDDVLRESQDALTDAGVPVSCNLVGPIFVNQAAAFSDFHVSGANPAGNATLCDAAFVANRFRMVHTRVLL